ncbi:MAG: helix-hairpin-helix domain-containing protein [Pseudomonadota bacterium]
MSTGSTRPSGSPLPLVFLLLLCSSCSGDDSVPAAGREEGTCLTFSADDVPGWSACLPDPGGFVPEALVRMELDRCLEAWDALDGAARDALVASGRIHVDRGCRFSAGPGMAAASALLSLERPVDLNLATVKDLQALPGVGPALSERILASRHVDGPFCSVDALTRVKGIGPKTLEQLRPHLTAGCE